MSDSTEKEEILEVKEQVDGSATVELPEDEAVGQQAQDANDDHDDDGSDDGRDEDDPVRQARRARRKAKKELIKRTNEEKDHRLVMLTRQNELMAQRIAEMEKRFHGADLARMDSAIEDEIAKLEFFKRKMQEATDNSDGAAFTQAQEAWYDSRRKVEAMQYNKNRAVQQTNQDQGAVNPRLIELANDWMSRNPWYDPSGGDEDSQIAKVIDNRLAAEGWDPSTREYWEEFDRRLQKRIPSRYTEDRDEQPQRRPRTFVTGSSRESVGGSRSGNTFVLEPEQVRAMKDAGFWDDPQKRAKMIKRYAEQSRNNRG